LNGLSPSIGGRPFLGFITISPIIVGLVLSEITKIVPVSQSDEGASACSFGGFATMDVFVSILKMVFQKN
jgi:hypothetical protein